MSTSHQRSNVDELLFSYTIQFNSIQFYIRFTILHKTCFPCMYRMHANDNASTIMCMSHWHGCSYAALADIQPSCLTLAYASSTCSILAWFGCVIMAVQSAQARLRKATLKMSIACQVISRHGQHSLHPQGHKCQHLFFRENAHTP